MQSALGGERSCSQEASALVKEGDPETEDELIRGEAGTPEKEPCTQMTLRCHLHPECRAPSPYGASD